MDKVVRKWAPGTAYGPILGQTDLYLLQTELEINPILKGEIADLPLQFHLVTGFSTNSRNQGDPNVYGKDEPATLPRVQQIIIISRYSPWCTIVKKDTGVTIGDICSAIYKDYTDNDISEAEFGSLNPRGQEQLKRTAGQNSQHMQPQSAASPWGSYYPAAPPTIDRLRRVDWLRDKVYFEGISRDDNYVRNRLGFKAPNIFVMDLTS